MRQILGFTLLAAILAAGCTTPAAPTPKAPVTRGTSTSGTGPTPSPAASFPTDLGGNTGNSGGVTPTPMPLPSNQAQAAQTDVQSLTEALGASRDMNDYSLIVDGQLNGVIAAGAGNVIAAGAGNYRVLDTAASSTADASMTATDTAAASDTSATTADNASDGTDATDTPPPLPDYAPSVPDAAAQKVIAWNNDLYRKAAKRLSGLSEASLLAGMIASDTPDDNGDGTLTKKISLDIDHKLYGIKAKRHVVLKWTYNAATKLCVASKTEFTLQLPNGVLSSSIRKVAVLADGTEDVSYLDALIGADGVRHVVSLDEAIDPSGKLTGTGKFKKVKANGNVSKNVAVTLSGSAGDMVATEVDPDDALKATVTLPEDADPTATVQATDSSATAQPSVSLDPQQSDAP
ncbi:MAG TPA: hypothetical protein V6D47_03995 [Oscillatoriaceae cyanobacterium]